MSAPTSASGPKTVLFTYDVEGPSGHSRHYGPDQVKASWSGPHVCDEWWSLFFQDAWQTDWTAQPFNPRIGAGVYGNSVLLPLGPFEDTGKYAVTESWWTAKPTTDMLYCGDPALPVH
jgi:hypothetical protein